MKTTDLMALDTNVILYGDDPGSPHHNSAKTVMDAVFDGSLPACLSHQILAEYFSVATSLRRLKHPLSLLEAKERVLFIERSRRVKKIYPKRSTLKRAIRVCLQYNLQGPRVFDAIYATTLLDNGIIKLCTHNTRDFVSFKPQGLHTLTPEEAQNMLRA